MQPRRGHEGGEPPTRRGAREGRVPRGRGRHRTAEAWRDHGGRREGGHQRVDRRGSLRGLSADVVHAHSPPPLASHYAGAVASERGIPYVVTYHCDVELPSAFGSVVESIYRRSLGADTLRNANQVIVTTRTYAATSRAIWRYNPSVIPNAVDHRRFRPDVDGSAVRAKLRIPPEVPIVLLVGRIVPHKGVEHLVEAARYVPDARFLVAGGGWSLDAMKRLALSMGVADRVRFLGRISDDRLPEVYAACDVVVLPSGT